MDAIHFINKYKNNIVGLLVILVALMIANNIYQGQAKVIVVLKANRDAEVKKNELLSGIAKLETKIGEYKKLLNTKSASAVINTLNGIAKDTGVSIVSLKPKKEYEEPFYVNYPFTLSIKAANYHVLGDFISRLENNPDFYIVELLTINKEMQDGSLSSALSAEITLNTVALRDPL